MKHALCLCLLLAAPPAIAQQSGPAEEGFDLIERGAELLLRQFAEDFGPGLEGLMEHLGDRLDGLPGYHAPEILPNGDIIIRRKDPLAPGTPPGDEVEI